MLSICNTDCCSKCSRREACGGCTKVEGHPFGGRCIAAECIKKDGVEAFTELKKTWIEVINNLGIMHLHINDLYLLNGFYVNLEYQLANGLSVKLLSDNNVYLGNQIEIPGSDRCYGIVVDDNYLLVSEYGCGGSDPKIILYQRKEI